MASHRRNRTMRGALAASAVLAAIGFAAAPTPALADPPAGTPPASNDPVAQFKALSQQADILDQQINNAKVDLANKQAAQAKAQSDIATAKTAEQAALARENTYRVQVDKLTDASFEGARFDQMSALLTGTSVQDYLNRASDLQNLAEDNAVALNSLSSAVNAAQAAETRAQHDEQTSQQLITQDNNLLSQLQQQQAQLTQQTAQVQQALHKLSPAQQKTLATDTGPNIAFIPPSGIAGAAMQAALNERGKPYVYGADGPNSFDCSGLVDFVYAQSGMGGLPHSAAALSHMGTAVPMSQIQPGDLVFFGSPAYHVGIYVGNGMMVNAPAPGQVVKVEALLGGLSGVRRLG